MAEPEKDVDAATEAGDIAVMLSRGHIPRALWAPPAKREICRAEENPAPRRAG